jgi:1,4-alpha-glucan branching enzyme
MPLLGTDESVRAQVRTAVTTHIRHIGKHPRGIWAPECGYRPGGFWDYPVQFASEGANAATQHPGFERIGVEQALSESSLDFFFVDTHLVEESQRSASPYELMNGSVVRDAKLAKMTQGPQRSLYQPYYVDGNYGTPDGSGRRYATTIFPRDPRTGLQVWSGDHGYPGDPNYLDFHKKRFPGGHRYWKVTGANVDIADKQTYDVHDAGDRAKVHAAHFADLCRSALEESVKAAGGRGAPPILCALFDAELFGHWWFEGVMWLEAVARELHRRSEAEDISRIDLIDCQSYLERYPPVDSIAMREGSWGSGGSSQVWLNPQTSWTWARLYPAQLYVREMATEGGWRESESGTRIARQLCRELLLLESSDWQFLIATGAARDYAESRFATHSGYFDDLRGMYGRWLAEGAISAEEEERLATIEVRDSVFMDLDPGLWAIAAASSLNE